MIKKVLMIGLLLSLTVSLFGCRDTSVLMETQAASFEATIPETKAIEQSDSNYIVRNEWMTFCFSKDDFEASEVLLIADEALGIMADVRQYLGVTYTTREARDSVCYFDRAYRNADGEKRSMCYWDEKEMYCISLDDFVHEYVHMVSGNHAELVYQPDVIYVEGLAQYVGLHFFHGIASRKYSYFGEPRVSEFPNAKDHGDVCDLILDNGFEYTAENYTKAVMALLSHMGYRYQETPLDEYFVKYYVGAVFADYCINQRGGVEKFMSVYGDSVTGAEVYGKPIDELVREALDHNKQMFQKNQ